MDKNVYCQKALENDRKLVKIMVKNGQKRSKIVKNWSSIARKVIENSHKNWLEVGQR
jgi:hypothetical protein